MLFTFGLFKFPLQLAAAMHYCHSATNKPNLFIPKLWNSKPFQFITNLSYWGHILYIYQLLHFSPTFTNFSFFHFSWGQVSNNLHINPWLSRQEVHDDLKHLETSLVFKLKSLKRQIWSKCCAADFLSHRKLGAACPNSFQPFHWSS